MATVVYGVEPNAAMRAAAEKVLAGNPRFHSVDGTAEQTTLLDQSIDFVVAGQAFHWFDRQLARREFSRILRPGGWTVLIWNERRVDTSPFLKAYEALLDQFAIDYRQVDHRNVDEAAIGKFFAPAKFECRRLDNMQSLDLAGLAGRIASSSYMPAAEHPNHPAMMRSVEQLFEQHEQAGRVEIEYDTLVYFGRLD